MNYPEESSDLDDKIEKEFKEEYQYNVKIAECLNQFENIVEPNPEFHFLFNFSEKDRYIVYDLIQLKIKYLKDNLEKPTSLQVFCLNLFEFLFLKNNEISYEEINNKIYYFKIILCRLSGKNVKDKENAIIDELSKDNVLWSNVVEILRKKDENLCLIFCTFLNFSKTNEPLIKFLFDILKKYYDFKIHFEIKDLLAIDDFEVSNIFNDLLSTKVTNYFDLYIKNGNIEKRLMSPDDTLKALFGNENEKSNKDQPKKNEKANDGTKKRQKETKKKEDNIQKSSNEKDPNNQEIKKNDEEKQKNKMQKNKLACDNNKALLNLKDNASIQSQRKTENEIIQNLNEKVNSLETRNKELENKIGEIKNKNKQLEEISDSMSKSIEKYQSTNRTLKMKLRKNQNEIFSLKAELSKVQGELDLIKARGALKAFIDFFYKGLKFKYLAKYERKVEYILDKIGDLKKDNENDRTIIYMITKLLGNTMKKLNLGNTSAHDLDLSDSVIEKIFKIIDPNGECTKVLERLNEANVNSFIINLIWVRKMYYYNKNMLEEKENNIYEKLDIGKFLRIFKRKPEK